MDAETNVSRYGASQTSADDIRTNVSLKAFLTEDFPWREVSYEQHDLSQRAYVTDRRGRSLVDFLGRFERLQTDFDRVCDAIGISRAELPQKNRTDRAPYWEYYDEETRQIVANKYETSRASVAIRIHA